MLEEVGHILSADGPVAGLLDGFEPRPQQIQMAERVQRSLEQKGHLLVEAGTGVGKTFAYLLPSLQRIIDHNERVVVSTHTISLQEQLLERDIPFLRQVLPDDFRAVLVKGRGNYVSVRRLDLASRRQKRLFADEASLRSLRVIQDWAYETKDGTQATLPTLERPAIWDRVQSDSGNCMGRKCTSYDKCFYQAARREMQRADLLICNHALFFSDLALRAQGVSFLPPFDHVIIDEAHQVEDVASDHFGRALSEGRVWHLLSALYHERSGRGFLSDLKVKDEVNDPVSKAVEQVRRCGEVTRQMFDDLNLWRRSGGPSNGRINEPDVVENVVTPALRDLGLLLKDLRKHAKREADTFELNAYAERASSIAEDAELILTQSIENCVYWLEARGGDGNGLRRLALAAAPVDVAPILRERLFGLDAGVVLTSATLTLGGAEDEDDAGFKHIIQQLGCDDAETLRLGSPFDHASQVELIVDQTMPSPNAPDYVDELSPRIEQHVHDTDGGAFVLFTSYVTMKRVAERLRPAFELDGRDLFVQGEDGSRTLILDAFRDDRRAVLFGAASFWQGVDVRGEGLRNVIITRLPFDPPDRPLTEARAERITADGGSPFMQDQLPRAIIRFKQGFGRLIRSASDTGRVVVLDPRLITKRYGNLFLRALPEGVILERVGVDD